MKLSQPRITPLTEAEWTDEQCKVLEPVYKEGRVYNVLGTLARHWEASKKFGVWGYHVMGTTSTLLPRERELLILRIGWLCQAEYEWGQHVIFGKGAGLTDAEIARIKEGPDAAGWAPFDATLLRAADELHAEACISDATWAALSARYNTEQLMDVVFTEVVAHIAWEKTLNLQRPLRRSRYTPTTVPRIRAVGEWRVSGMGV